MTGSVRYTAPDPSGIARLTLTNPGKLNALSVAMWRELRTHVARRNVHHDGVRVVIVCGEGGQFASGGDIEEFPQFRFDAATLARFHEEDVRPALQALLDCDLPLIAQIDGACVGGGLEVAACCDIRIAGSSARFGVPIARLGFPLAPAELEIVAAVVGPTVLRELLIEARVLTAQEAFARGLVTRVVADADVAAEVRTAAERIAELSPQALRLNKRALRQFTHSAHSSHAERAPHYAYAASDEHREGLAAFNEKRQPRF
jgi:enoyl-CoA hydratase